MNISKRVAMLLLAMLLFFIFQKGYGQVTNRRDSLNTDKKNWILEIYDQDGNLYGFSYDHRPSTKDSLRATLITKKAIMKIILNPGQTPKKDIKV